MNCTKEDRKAFWGKSFFWTLMILTCFGCAHQRETKWAAYEDHGDKPGIGFVIIVDQEKISGEFYLLDPSYPGDFAKGAKMPMQDVKRDGLNLTFSTVLPNGQPFKRTLKFQGAFEGQQVQAILISDTGKDLGPFTFQKQR